MRVLCFPLSSCFGDVYFSWHNSMCHIISYFIHNDVRKTCQYITSEKLWTHSFRKVFNAADGCRCKVCYLYTWFCSVRCINTLDSDEFLYVAFNQNVYCSSSNTTSMPFHFFILQDILFKSIDANFERDCKTHFWIFFFFFVCASWYHSYKMFDQEDCW
jgi:hypothetical protein